MLWRYLGSELFQFNPWVDSLSDAAQSVMRSIYGQQSAADMRRPPRSDCPICKLLSGGVICDKVINLGLINSSSKVLLTRIFLGFSGNVLLGFSVLQHVVALLLAVLFFISLQMYRDSETPKQTQHSIAVYALCCHMCAQMQ